ncbi:MAG: hypothetical protein QOC83_6529, partial [Pseudonocardiales bacterium]|nr:hypothetical protein [Pseudonocardiales bacterium]
LAPGAVGGDGTATDPAYREALAAVLRTVQHHVAGAART